MNTQNDKTKSHKITIRNWIESDKLKDQIAKSLPRHLTPDRWLRTAMTAVQKTPMLLECSQESLFQAMMNLSQTGLEPDGYHAHLIPYRNRKFNRIDCQLIIDYKGMIRMIRNSPEIEDVYAEVVYSNDDFEIELGTNKRIIHKPTISGPRGQMIGVYSVAVIKDSPNRSFDWMSKDEIEKIRARSKSPNDGPWVTDFAEMARKTVVKRHSKYLPITIDAIAGIKTDDELERPQPVNVTPKATPKADFLDMTMPEEKSDTEPEHEESTEPEATE